jgi:hypothetical protein
MSHSHASLSTLQEITMVTVAEERLQVAPIEGLRISWGGIWAGVLTVMGTLLFLTTLGFAIGVTAVSPGETDAQAVGTGAAIWTGLSLLIALFAGGMAASRLGMVFDKAAGAFEGALVWVLSFLIVLWLASSGVQLIASGISGIFSGIGQTVSSTVSGAAGIGDLSGGNADQILSRLNDPQTARMIASATNSSEDEVRSQLGGIAQRVEAARNDPSRVAAEVRQGTEQLMARARQQLPAVAQQAQEGATKAAWFTFAAMLISLLAAIGGSMLGRRRVVATLAESRTVTASAAATPETVRGRGPSRPIWR